MLSAVVALIVFYSVTPFQINTLKADVKQLKEDDKEFKKDINSALKELMVGQTTLKNDMKWVKERISE